MSHGRVLAIDQGTSSTKALVIADDGAVLGRADVPVELRHTADGGVEQDPNDLLDSVLLAGRTALRESRGGIDAVGLANQGESVLAWNRAAGTPLSAAVNWNDRRSTRICDERREWESELRAITGLALDPYFAAPKIRWLRENVTAAGVATTTDSWLIHELCGAYVTDAATSSRTLLLDLDRVEWSPRACDVFEIDPTTLPDIVACELVVGETSAFGQTCPVVGLAVDQQAALFGQGCINTGDAKCTYGTGAFLLAAAGPAPKRSRSGLVTSVAWMIGDSTAYCLEGQVYTAGSAIDWLIRLGLLESPQDLDAVVESASPEEGPVFVPALSGLAAPYWRPAARGSFTGLSLATTRPQLVRSVVEGIAASVAVISRSAADDLGSPLTSLRVDGGLARSRALMQTQADLLQIPVEVHLSFDATAFGVAALSGLGIRQPQSFAGAGAERQTSAVYMPAISPDRAQSIIQRCYRAAEATLQ